MHEPRYETPPDAWDDAGWERFGRGGDYEAPTLVAPLLTQVSTVQPEPITWLWETRIPMSALTLLDGHPDTGKSTITLDLAARLSTGRRMPDGSRGIEGSTLLLATEDTLAKPVRERLEATGAVDLDRIYGLEATDDRNPFGRSLTFPEDAKILQQAVMHTEAKLVVIDPIMGHLSSTVNSGIDAEIRRALNPLVRVCVETGCAILMVRHLRKPERKSTKQVSFMEGGGSLGGFGIVRAGLMAERDPDDPSIATLYPTKHNYAPLVRPIDYTFEQTNVFHGVGRIRWLPR